MKILRSLPLFGLCLSSCFEANRGVAVLFNIKYTNKKVDKDALEQYFLNNKDEYSSYQELKENNPDVLNNAKVIESGADFFTSNDISLVRFSTNYNGYLNGETYLIDNTISNNDKVFHLGSGFGGYGVTQFVRQQGNAGFWFYFLYSFGSGIHKTMIGAYEMINHQLCSFDSLDLEPNKDYSLFVDKEDNISVYEADIVRTYDENNFSNFNITPKDVVISNLLDYQLL